MTRSAADPSIASEKTTVLYDGSCPLCRTEIGHYRRLDGADSLCFLDVAGEATPLPAGIDRTQAMARFHVRTGDGRLVSGATAFVEVWRRLPRWRVLARLADLPGVTPILEVGYRWTLRIRPWLVRAFVRLRGT